MGATSYTFSLCKILSKPVNREGHSLTALHNSVASSRGTGASQMTILWNICQALLESLAWGLDIRWGFYRSAPRSSPLPTRLTMLPCSWAELLWRNCFKVSLSPVSTEILHSTLVQYTVSTPSSPADTCSVWLCLNVNKPLSFDIKLLTQIRLRLAKSQLICHI